MSKFVLAVTLAAVAVFAAGCGGSHTPAVANLGTTTSRTPSSGTSSGGSLGGSEPEAGSSGSSGKTGLAFSVAGTPQEMTKFAACMRANGEPTFPDPNAQGVVSAGSLDRGSPQFEQALQACRKDMPGGSPTPAQQEQDLRRAVALSACMRRNGVPGFPDPQAGSGGSTVIRLGPGIDPSSPQFQKAQRTCQKQVPGSMKG